MSFGNEDVLVDFSLQEGIERLGEYDSKKHQVTIYLNPTMKYAEMNGILLLDVLVENITHEVLHSVIRDKYQWSIKDTKVGEEIIVRKLINQEMNVNTLYNYFMLDWINLYDTIISVYTRRRFNYLLLGFVAGMWFYFILTVVLT